MADAFDNILGQPHVREFLRTSVSNERVSHAYLFTGPAGSNKTRAAYALAKALLCENNGCNACAICQSIERQKHPDVHYVAPEGAREYLVDQVRTIVSDTTLAPIQASYKVYILDRVDLLGAAAANAFLKTLEEPPANVVLILLGRTRESVLPTIVSRCQVVPFRHIPAHEAASIIAQNTGASTTLAKIAVEACGGSMTRAIKFLGSNERLAFRSRVLDVLMQLRTSDEWDIIVMARELVTRAKAPLDTVRAAQEAQLAENADFLAKSAIRQIAARNKRQITAASLASLNQLTAITQSYLRDVLVVCAQTPELVINTDIKHQIHEAALHTDMVHVTRALEAVRTCETAISYNVSPETCIDAMLFEIRKTLYGSNSSR